MPFPSPFLLRSSSSPSVLARYAANAFANRTPTLASTIPTASLGASFLEGRRMLHAQKAKWAQRPMIPEALDPYIHPHSLLDLISLNRDPAFTSYLPVLCPSQPQPPPSILAKSSSTSESGSDEDTSSSIPPPTEEELSQATQAWTEFWSNVASSETIKTLAPSMSIRDRKYLIKCLERYRQVEERVRKRREEGWKWSLNSREAKALGFQGVERTLGDEGDNGTGGELSTSASTEEVKDSRRRKPKRVGVSEDEQKDRERELVERVMMGVRRRSRRGKKKFRGWGPKVQHGKRLR